MARHDQREVVSELVWRDSTGVVGLYRLIEEERAVTVADGGRGDMGEQWHGRGHGGVQGVMASVTSVLEQ